MHFPLVEHLHFIPFLSPQIKLVNMTTRVQRCVVEKAAEFLLFLCDRGMEDSKCPTMEPWPSPKALEFCG